MTRTKKIITLVIINVNKIVNSELVQECYINDITFEEPFLEDYTEIIKEVRECYDSKVKDPLDRDLLDYEDFIKFNNSNELINFTKKNAEFYNSVDNMIVFDDSESRIVKIISQ